MGKPAKRRWKLKDLQGEEIRIHEWSLEKPRTQYTATAAHYGHQSGLSVLSFAQMIGEVAMNGLAVMLPVESITEILLPSLGNIRERLARLHEEGKIKPAIPLELDKLERIGDRSHYLLKSANRVRVATGDHFASLDFYQLPIVPPQLIQERPHEELEIEGVLRVVMSTSVFHALVKQMEAVEGYEPEEPHEKDTD